MRAKLTSAVLAATLIAASGADVREGLVSYWPLDTVSGDLTSTPDLVSGNHFTLYNFWDASGHIDGRRGKALLFNGVDQYAAFTATPEVNSGLPASKFPQFTVAFWAKGAGTGQNDRRMFSEGSTLSNDPLFNLGTHNAGTDGTVDVFIRDGGVAVNHAHSTAVGLDDAWHHIAWTDSNGVARLYIDGQLDSSYNYARANTPIDVTSIGAILRAAPGSYFAGAIDDVAIWDRAISQEEVQSVMANGIPTPIAPAAPTFTLQPVASTNVVIGKSVSLSAFASGSRPVTYQWQKNGQPITGATSWRLTLNNLQTADAGAYRLVVQNSAGSSTSAVAQVTVEPPPAPNLTNGLVAYYPFETVTGTKTPDLINGLDMDLSNLTAADLVNGQKGKTFAFSNARRTLVSRVSGTNDFLPINKHESFTISLWAQVDGLGQADLRLFSEGSTTSSDPLFNIGTGSTGGSQAIDLFFRRSGWTVVNHILTEGTPLDGTWHHIVFVQDAGQRAIYIDGLRDPLEIPAKPAGAWPVNTTSIGGILRASQSHWVTGLIDEVAFWTRALSPEEINRVKNEGVPVVTSAPAPLAVRTFTADFPMVVSGDNVTLRWDVTKDVAVNISGIGDVTSRTVAGVGQTTVPLTQDSTFTLTLTRGQETTNATVSVRALKNVASGWSVIENFESRSAGGVTGQGFWKNPEGMVNVRDLGPNNVLGFDGNGGDLSALPLNSLTVDQGERATLFFRAFSPTNDATPIGVNVGLTERPIRFTGDFANNVGPLIRFERFEGETDITVQARNGVGGAFDYGAVPMQPGKVYNFWIDVRNNSFESGGDVYSVYMAEAVQSARTLLFDQYVSDRDQAGTPDLGAAGTNLHHLFIVANMAAQSANALLLDDFFLSSGNAFAASTPVPAGTFIQQAEPTSIRITSFSANAGPGSFTLSWEAANGARYHVLKATALDGQWAQVGGVVTAAGPTATFTDTSASGRMAFYRVTLAP